MKKSHKRSKGGGVENSQDTIYDVVLKSVQKKSKMFDQQFDFTSRLAEAPASGELGPNNQYATDIPIVNGATYVENMVKDLLRDNDAKSVERNWQSKLCNKVLLLDAPQVKKKTKFGKKKNTRSSIVVGGSQQIKNNNSNNEPQLFKTMSSKARKNNARMNWKEIPQKALQYTLYEKMNMLWEKHACECFIVYRKANRDDRDYVIYSDMHGALIKVVESKSPHLNLVEGITIVETARTFVLITKQNELKQILKNGGNILEVTIRSHQRSGEGPVNNDACSTQEVVDQTFRFDGKLRITGQGLGNNNIGNRDHGFRRNRNNNNNNTTTIKKDKDFNLLFMSKSN